MMQGYISARVLRQELDKASTLAERLDVYSRMADAVRQGAIRLI